MDFNAPDHIYNCIPAVLGNDKSENPVAIGLQVVTVPEMDSETMACRGLAAEAIEKRTRDLIRGKDRKSVV